MRAALFERDPLCASCKAAGLVVLATQRDHIVPLEEGGADDASNEQGLCTQCHDEKSLGERLRGLRGAFPRGSRGSVDPGVGRKSGAAGRKPSGSP
nr:HNH endonuclease signature motif containing protein [Pseudacidovorax sp. RU35E]